MARAKALDKDQLKLFLLDVLLKKHPPPQKFGSLANVKHVIEVMYSDYFAYVSFYATIMLTFTHTYVSGITKTLSTSFVLIYVKSTPRLRAIFSVTLNCEVTTFAQETSTIGTKRRRTLPR